MRHSWLGYLLIFLIALQPVMAVADVHPINQNEGSNNDLGYQLNLLYEIDVPSAKNATAQNPDYTVDDCLDCSYCYCCAYFTLYTVNLNTSFGGAGNFNADYELSIIEILYFPFLRPPKT